MLGIAIALTGSWVWIG